MASRGDSTLQKTWAGPSLPEEQTMKQTKKTKPQYVSRSVPLRDSRLVSLSHHVAVSCHLWHPVRK